MKGYESFMKIGARKPSIKKRVTAKTTGKIVRSAKRSVNPLYGKKGMGYVNNPKKAVYNKVYNKTTFGIDDIFTSSNSTNSQYYSNKEINNESWSLGGLILAIIMFGVPIFIAYKIFSFVFWFFS